MQKFKRIWHIIWKGKRNSWDNSWPKVSPTLIDPGSTRCISLFSWIINVFFPIGSFKHSWRNFFNRIILTNLSTTAYFMIHNLILFFCCCFFFTYNNEEFRHSLFCLKQELFTEKVKINWPSVGKRMRNWSFLIIVPFNDNTNARTISLTNLSNQKHFIEIYLDYMIPPSRLLFIKHINYIIH